MQAAFTKCTLLFTTTAAATFSYPGPSVESTVPGCAQFGVEVYHLLCDVTISLRAADVAAGAVSVRQRERPFRPILQGQEVCVALFVAGAAAGDLSAVFIIG